MRKDSKNAYMARGGTFCPFCRLPLDDERIRLVNGWHPNHPDTRPVAAATPPIPEGQAWLQWHCDLCDKTWDEFTKSTEVMTVHEAKEVRVEDGP